ncbi:MAG: tetratricopeptide repeat protein [Cyanobacteria bacterium J06639_1]
MDASAVLEWLDELAIASRREALSELQRAIVKYVLQNQTYSAIADRYGCTEGHAKDVGSELWQWLSRELNEKVSKRNLRRVLERAIASPGNNPSERLADDNQDERWVGRQREFAHLDALVARGAQAIVIQGEGGIGKTAIAQRYLQQRQFDCVLELMLAKDPQQLGSVERAVEEWLDRDFQLEPGRDFSITLSRLQRQLRQQRVAILIDNLEPALDDRGQFLPPARGYVELLRAVAGGSGRSLTLITSRDRLCEAHLHVEHLRLSGLAERDWQEYGRNFDLDVNAAAWRTLHRVYGGNAKALRLLCGAIQTDWDGDVAAYWRECGGNPLAETDLSNLINSHLHRLQNLDPDAYKLLCRLSCFRFQDIPRVSSAGAIALAWDVPEGDCLRLLVSLRNRSVVDYRQGRYGLHPAMQAAARQRLKQTSDEIQAHRHAAEYWTTSVDAISTRAEALQALEAFYHYVAIAEYSRAGAVLIASRNNRWHQYLSLGGILYRLGLVRPLREAVTLAIAYLPENDGALAELYNLSGDTHWIAGDVWEAIAAQTQALQLTRHHSNALDERDTAQRRYFEIAELDSLLSLGLYALDLWELTEAADYFQQVIDLARSRQRDRWTNKALTCLALTRAHARQPEAARTLADRAYRALLDEPASLSTGRFAYFLQLLGRAFVVSGERDRARDLLQRTAKFAAEGHYSQVEAKARDGLAQVHRLDGDYHQAIALHEEAIALLDEVGARCDLAEATFQLSRTFQQMGNRDGARDASEKAIALFGQIPAPKQVAKVRATLRTDD